MLIYRLAVTCQVCTLEHLARCEHFACLHATVLKHLKDSITATCHQQHCIRWAVHAILRCVMTSEVTLAPCKRDHVSHHARHVSLAPTLHVAAKDQACLKTPCCIAISHQHTVSSVAMMLCCLANMSCCSTGLEDLQRCHDHKEEGGGSEASASCLPSFLHCCLLHCPQSCRRHHHTQLPAGHPSMHPSIQ